MTRYGARPGPDDRERDGPELEMAARVADRAAPEGPRGADASPLDEQLTWGKDADPDYQQALDDIAFLAAVRLEVSRAALSDKPRDEPRVLGSWGPFEIVERLGGGASGEVYKARDRHLNNHVALKLFHRERVASVELDTLLVEGRQHALVKHPNIAVIHGADENDGRVGIWMEYIDGSTLQELVETQGTFGAAEAMNIARELCSALAAVHQRGLTHGDIKAQNVMREKGGRIVLMDFSSSRQIELEAEASDRLAGTPIYMAPELFDGKPSDFRSDVYSLGVLLFYLVTGRHPYEARNLRELKEAVASNNPLLLDDLRPDLPPGFIRAVHKALARSPEDRFQSAGELQAALREALTPEWSAPPAGGAEPVSDLKPLVRAARVVTWSVLVTAFLALLGYSNEFFFNMALNIPYKLTNYSLTTAAVVGLRSLSFLAVNAVIGAVVLAVVWGVMRILGANRMSLAVGRLVERVRRAEFVQVATVYALVCVAGVAGTIVYFADFLAAIGGVFPGNMQGDLSLLQLACGGEPVHAIRFALGFSRVSLVLALGWFLVFERLRPSIPLAPAARFMKWVSALAIVVGIGVMATPWRLLWQSESVPIELEDGKGYVVAEDEDNLYVYSPEAPAREQHRVIQRGELESATVGVPPEYLFGEESCGEGDGS